MAHGDRRAILRVIGEGEQSERVGLDQPVASQHLKVLRSLHQGPHAVSPPLGPRPVAGRAPDDVPAFILRIRHDEVLTGVGVVAHAEVHRRLVAHTGG